MKITLEQFIEFAETQTGEYDYTEPWTCPFAIFLKSLGCTDVEVGPTNAFYKMPNGKRGETRLSDIHPDFDDALVASGLVLWVAKDWTWEALTKRLQSLSK